MSLKKLLSERINLPPHNTQSETPSPKKKINHNTSLETSIDGHYVIRKIVDNDPSNPYSRVTTVGKQGIISDIYGDDPTDTRSYVKEYEQFWNLDTDEIGYRLIKVTYANDPKDELSHVITYTDKNDIKSVIYAESEEDERSFVNIYKVDQNDGNIYLTQQIFGNNEDDPNSWKEIYTSDNEYCMGIMYSNSHNDPRNIDFNKK